MSDLEELLEAIDEVIGVEDLSLEELEKAGHKREDFACPHIDRLREVRRKFGPSS